jgi:hypothetical protein
MIVMMVSPYNAGIAARARAGTAAFASMRPGYLLTQLEFYQAHFGGPIGMSRGVFTIFRESGVEWAWLTPGFGMRDGGNA